MGKERKEIKGMGRGWGSRTQCWEEEEAGARLGCGSGSLEAAGLGGGGRLPASLGTPLFTHKGGPSCVRARGQMDREEVQWEGIYANISLSLLPGVLNIV